MEWLQVRKNTETNLIPLLANQKITFRGNPGIENFLLFTIRKSIALDKLCG